jgi:hypothetical protein
MSKPFFTGFQQSNSSATGPVFGRGVNLEPHWAVRGAAMRNVNGCLAAALLGLCAACGGGEEVPALEQQSTTAPQATSMPERVQGCLGAGEAEGTYVLTAGAIDTGADAATYQLMGQTDALADHIGRRVEVTGTIVSEQVAQSRGPAMPAEARDEAEPTGTSGRATVQSHTEIELKRLQVSSVTPIDADCGDER